MAEHGVGKSLILHGFREKKRSGEREGGSHKEDQGTFQSEFTGKEEDSSPGPGTSMNKETGEGN